MEIGLGSGLRYRWPRMSTSESANSIFSDVSLAHDEGLQDDSGIRVGTGEYNRVFYTVYSI